MVETKTDCSKSKKMTSEGYKPQTLKDFYSLQQAYLNWRNCTSERLVNSYRIYTKQATEEMIDDETLTNEQADRIIDYYNLKKQSNDDRTT